ncbi:DUF4123 domain-containing protein [Vogesella mureinivorans]|uniref:DUF4123 domain-containing protein n=1 Tax=Vogesella mureinivorans TaxID=657276 RepID=UPI0011C90FD0|nr:DUF4123 domain-containing protein [Vogesella mureinivorans]
MMTPRQNPYTEQSLLMLQQHIEQQTGYAWYAMMDHLMQPALVQKLGKHAAHLVNLYGDASPLELAASPVLLPLPVAGETRNPLLALLLQACNGLPMLSFWASPLPVSQLVQHFARYQDVCLQPDSTIMVLRYADTRIQPSLLRQLTPAQRNEWLAPFTHMLAFDAHAEMHVVTGSQQARQGEGKLSLSPEQWGSMIDDALPDFLFDDIASRMPPTLPADLYADIQRRLAEARRAGCQDEAAIIAYCLQHD